MIFKTFRLRFTVIYTVLVSSFFLLFASAVYIEYRKELLETVDRDLMRVAKTEESNPDPTKNSEIIKRIDDEYYRIMNRNSKVIITHLDNNQQWPVNRKIMLLAFKGAPRFDTVRYRGENYRTLYFPVREDTIIRVGKSLESTEKTISRLEKLFLIFSPFLLALSSLASWFLAGKLLNPLVKIKSFAEQIRQGRLGERINVEFKGKEIEDLVAIFNDVLDSVQSSIEAQKRFTSGVSHEIRSPLTSLRGSIEVALRKKRTPGEYEEVLRNNLTDIMRISKIIGNLLFLSRADNNALEFRRQWFDVRHFMEAVVEGFKDNTLSADITIIEDYQENLELHGDVDLLEQAFSNLVDNAVKYTAPGGRISIKTIKENSTIKVIISDTGIGIPEDEIPHIFERFYRVNKERSRKLGGAGLGLAITQWIINAHNGEIMVNSNIGKGSDFIVVFPKNSD